MRRKSIWTLALILILGAIGSTYYVSELLCVQKLKKETSVSQSKQAEIQKKIELLEHDLDSIKKALHGKMFSYSNKKLGIRFEYPAEFVTQLNVNEYSNGCEIRGYISNRFDAKRTILSFAAVSGSKKCLKIYFDPDGGRDLSFLDHAIRKITKDNESSLGGSIIKRMQVQGGEVLILKGDKGDVDFGGDLGEGGIGAVANLKSNTFKSIRFSLDNMNALPPEVFETMMKSLIIEPVT